MVDPEGRLKVTDFGIARAEQAGASQMTEAGSIIGTAQYLSPEQARGAPVDQTSDLYSLGIVLYELLTGSVPFTGTTPVEVAMKHLSAVPEAPSAKRPEIPRELDLVVLRALAKDPRDRYQSAEEMDADLERVAGGLAVAPATQEAATTIMRGAALAAAAPTTITRAPTAVTTVRPPPGGPPPFYDYDEPAAATLDLALAARDPARRRRRGRSGVRVPADPGRAERVAARRRAERGRDTREARRREHP